MSATEWWLCVVGFAGMTIGGLILGAEFRPWFRWRRK